MKSLLFAHKPGILSVCALAATLFLAQAAQGQVILYNETFSGSSGDNLVGSEPDVTVGENVWEGNTAFKQDGSNTTGSSAAAYLPMTYETETIYRFTLDFDMSAASTTNWVGIGFSNYSPGSLPTNGRDWFILRQNGITAAWAGGGTANKLVDEAATGLTVGNGMNLTLVATTGLTLNDTTIDMFVSDGTNTFTLDLNGAAAGTSRTGVDLGSAHQFFGVGASQGVGTFQNFEIAIIPEPSAASLLLGGLGMILLLRRRQRAR